ncbi:MAG: type II toxin-antitoxin system VapC family toxin [Deltaproteobacteria bacterium]|nr:type II toxin-antitoxin system VapC family toxin [Deltaproteobacteria bacterium]MBW2026952.1 type II toxin-antitoxin system VapC family toxin [Deltaproteobacteria bacterium]MBW2126127.1 type II toxin-antitoxin system VapC family toxin [Deltaproteobacteria bacterium]RLB15797.1 MAG: type II toxin-antitoxin system VapC family toxin [Deltaproteobacteria bacterium]RLB20980.1 MAG: type II toxin-antitoxin system VapC family toxin [Deltaproteobacteria bacterium]
MPKAILVDTDVLVDFFRGYSKAVSFVNSNSDRIILSSIVVAELYAGVKGEEEQFILDSFVSLFPVVAVTAEIAKTGGLYKRDYGKSHGVGLADAILAATAEAEDAELKTLNTKHYPMLRGLKPAYRK